MSSLWMKKMNLKLLTMQQRPSPKHEKYFQSLARGTIFFISKKISLLILKNPFIKRISLLTSLWGKSSGSMTVEAAILLPLFLFFFVNITSAVEMIRLHGNLELALWQCGNKITVLGNAVDNDLIPLPDEAGDFAISYFYIKNQIVGFLGEEYLNNGPLTNGTNSLQFWGSDICNEDDIVEINLTYEVSGETPFFPGNHFKMSNCYYSRLWTGYDIAGEKETEEIVYITEYGEVYHENRACTHLELSVQKIMLMQVGDSRNAHGEKYKECEKCKKGLHSNTVFITSEGNRYHYKENCSGLKRLVKAITKDNAVNYRPCSRCSK